MKVILKRWGGTIPMWNSIKLLIAIILIVFGLIMTGGVLVGISEGESTIASDFWIWFILAFIPFSVGIGLIFSRIRTKKHNKRQLLENEILRFAKKYDGSVTAAELAMETSLNLSEAEKELETFVRQGVATRKISDSGIFVYQFPMISDKEKSTAKSIYEI